MEVGSGVALDAISPRERDVLVLVGEHLTNAEIAGRLHVSVRTVESHVSSLLRKLGFDDRRALAAVAVDATTSGLRAGEFDGAPAVTTTFIGRARERAEVLEALDGSRLVTLVGPGGVGKTRLALEVVSQAVPELRGGATFVDLVSVRGEFLLSAVACSLETPERAGQSLEDALFEQLRAQPTLIVLDNCEHVLDEVAPFVDRLLATCAGVAVLATSRERLAVPAERIVLVPPLPLDGSDGESGSDATRLFIERARAVDESFDADTELIGALCARLDGMPLAIELAAARSASLGAEGLLAGLDDQLQLLTGGRQDTERHRSLRAMLAWSHDLLDDDERAVFRRLAVFAGGFDLAAAVAVAGDDRITAGTVVDVVGRLVDKNLLIRRRRPTGDRWRLLETVRAYALEQLSDHGEDATTRARHLAWAATTASDMEARIGNDDWEADFDILVDDLRSALANAPRDQEHDERAYALALTSGHLLYARHFPAEAQHHYEDAAVRAGNDVDAAVALRSAAHVAFARMRSDLSYPMLLDAADRFAAGGDAANATTTLAEAVIYGRRFPGEFAAPVDIDESAQVYARAAASAPAGEPVVDATLLGAEAWLSPTTRPVGVEDRAIAAVEAARALDDPLLLLNALDARATAAMRRGAMREAAALSFERLDLLGRIDRHDPRTGGEITDTYHMALESAVGIGALQQAKWVADLVSGDEVGRTVAFLTASRMVIPLAFMGEFDAALDESDRMYKAWERAGRPAARWMAPAACTTALVHGLRGDHRRYAEWFAYSRELSPKINGLAPFVEARVALHEARLDDAQAALGDVDDVTELFDPYGVALRAEVAAIAGAGDATDLLERAQLAARENDWARARVARARGRLTDDESQVRAALAGFEQIGARFEWAWTALLLDDVAPVGRTTLEELGCA